MKSEWNSNEYQKYFGAQFPHSKLLISLVTYACPSMICFKLFPYYIIWHCKQFRPKLSDTLTVFLKEFFEKLILKKVFKPQQKHEKSIYNSNENRMLSTSKPVNDYH